MLESQGHTVITRTNDLNTQSDIHKYIVQDAPSLLHGDVVQKLVQFENVQKRTPDIRIMCTFDPQKRKSRNYIKIIHQNTPRFE